MGSLLEKLNETSQKIQKSAQIMGQIGKIEVGTTPKELVWEMDKVRLFRYKRSSSANISTPLVISYALINRYDMLDLQPDRSLILNLLNLGLDIYVIDTGYPTRNERYLTMNDYINVYINGAVEYVRAAHQISKVNLMGICQGGTFSLIYSAIHPQKVKNLITLVTPVDFSKNDGLLYKWARDLDVDAVVEGFGGLIPGTFLDSGFQLLKPMLKVRKQKNLTDMLDNQDKLLNFYRMEKWINDLPDQAGETYRQFIKDLYQQNKLVKGDLIIGEHQVNLKNITMPILTIYASEDHLVPPSSTKPLNELIGSEDKQLYEFPGGHIGVFTGKRSQKELAPTIHQWFTERDAQSTPKEESKAVQFRKEPHITPSKESIATEKVQSESTESSSPEIIGRVASQKDDLQEIKGIGPSLAAKLNEIGISTFEQIAKLNEEELKNISELVNFAYTRIQKNQWIEQAKSLLKDS